MEAEADRGRVELTVQLLCPNRERERVERERGRITEKTSARSRDGRVIGESENDNTEVEKDMITPGRNTLFCRTYMLLPRGQSAPCDSLKQRGVLGISEQVEES